MIALIDSEGYDQGFWQMLMSVVLVSIGYIFLTLCLAEMTSAMPFGGACANSLHSV